MRAERGALNVIEAAYRPEPDRLQWLRHLVRAAAPLDEGLGVSGFFFDQDRGALRCDGFVSINSEAGQWEGLLQALTPTASAQRTANGAPCGTMSALMRRAPDPAVAEILRTQSFRLPSTLRDFMWINAHDPDGFGCQICVPLPRKKALTPRQRALWERLSGHITAGLRLQRASRWAKEAVAGGSAQAILDRGGRIQHADGDARPAAAREALRLAARALVRASEHLRREDPHRAVAIWKALIDGRWSLLDHYDSDGKRYLVAVRNQPRVTPSPRLSEREAQVVAYARLGHSNKLIAYELGLQPSTVATHLMHAARKLGVKGRRGLMRGRR